MANTVSKIERGGQAGRVQELYLKEHVTTAKGVAEVLRSEGFEISDASVARYLGKVKHTYQEEARKVIYDHVQAEIPKDLEALEEMESRCLDWSREDGKDLVARMASAAVEITGEVDQWAKRFVFFGGGQIEDKLRHKLVKSIIKDCLTYLTREAQFLDRRLRAIKGAQAIIETKLRYAAGLDSDGKGNIVILGNVAEYEKAQAQKNVGAGGTVQLRVLGAKPGGES